MRRWLASLHAQVAATSSLHFQHRPTFCASCRGYSTRIAELLRQQPNPNNNNVTINGFVRSLRKQKRVAFAVLGDGSCLQTLQVVLQPEQAELLSIGAAVSVKGTWALSPKNKEQTCEFQASLVETLGENDSLQYPLQKKWHTPEFLRTIPHLRSRTSHHGVLLRFRSEYIAALTAFFQRKGYLQSHTPIITSSDCEGAGEVFTVTPNTNKSHSRLDQMSPHGSTDHFFGDQTYLTVSSQLHLEALAQSVGKVWTLSPTFRAEHSNTPRHLSEFYMLEVELAFAEGLTEILDLVEETLRSTASSLKNSEIYQELLSRQQSVYEQCRENDYPTPPTPSELERRWEGICAKPWPRITFSRAVEIIKERAEEIAFETPVVETAGLHAEHERFIAEKVGQGSPVFVTDYPTSIKPFYMAPSDPTSADPGQVPTVACFDLLVPDACEIVGGSMREYRLGPLLDAMKVKKLNSPETLKALDWYVDLRRYGSVPHGGFGLGFDRLLAYLAGVQSIRDIVTFPRWYGRCMA